MEYKTLDNYLPHKAPMILLDNVLDVTEQFSLCEVIINHDSVVAPFLTEEGHLPAWYFVELMAQTIGIWNGVRLNHKEKLPNIALLLGIRGFSTSVDAALFGEVVHVKANLTLFDETICNFQCDVIIGDVVVSQANLIVYEAADQNIEQVFDWNKK